jgi:thymidylate synthase
MSYSLKYSEHENFREAYLHLINLIDKKGELISARNELTKEVLNTAVLIKNPRDRFIPLSSLNLPFIYQELFDIFNENQPRVIHSREMVKKTMGFDDNIMFFGNENRSGNSRWSLLKVRDVLRDDINSRKAVISYGSRRPKVHYPCLIYCHFIIRDNRLHLTVETRSTEVSVAWPNDVILFTTIQEIMLGWLKEFYPFLEMGEFIFKTISMHYFCDEKGKPNWSQDLIQDYTYKEMPFDLTHKEWVKENGVLYHYIDEYMKAKEVEDIDNGIITTYKDIMVPDKSYFNSEYFYKWALVLYHATRAKFNEEIIDFLKLWNNGYESKFKSPGISTREQG